MLTMRLRLLVEVLGVLAVIILAFKVYLTKGQVTQYILAMDTSPLVVCLTGKNVPLRASSDADWASYTKSYNIRLQYTPAVIILPENAQHISDAVVCASQNGVKVQAKSGGHSYASSSLGGQDGAMVVDLRNLQNVAVDNGTGIATAGGGLRLGNLELALKGHGRALAHGTCAGVGIGGHFSHGGYGFTSRAWGLAMDQIVALDVVLADGSLVHATETDNPEVYYVMRGAASSFGIIVNFYLQTQPAPPVITYFDYQFPDAASSVDNAVAAFTHLQTMAHDASVTDRNLGFGVTLGKHWFQLRGTYLGPASVFNTSILPEMLRTLPAPTSAVVQEATWMDSLALLAGGDLGVSTTAPRYTSRDNFFAKSVTIPDPGFSQEALTSYFAYALGQGANAPVSWYAIIDLYGGAGSQINTRAVGFAAFSHRGLAWTVQNYGFVGAEETFPGEGARFVQGLNDAITSTGTVGVAGDRGYGAYINYADPSMGNEEANRLYYGAELFEELRELKGRLDPGNVFANPQSIEPL